MNILWCGLGTAALAVGLLWLQRREHGRMASVRGANGERELYQYLREIGVPKQQIFRNAYLPTRSGTTEIDLVVVSKKGVFVFECKKYAGCICGDGRRTMWTQKMGKKTYRFLSPLVQNRAHVKWVRGYFGKIQGLPVIPCTVMAGAAEWRLENIKQGDHLLRPGEFKRVYRRLPVSKVAVRHFGYITRELKKCERTRWWTRRQHVRRVRGRK